MSRIRGPAIVCRFIQSTSQLCCRAATEGTWTVGVHAIPRSALPTLLSQLPQRDFTVSSLLQSQKVFESSFAVRPLSTSAATPGEEASKKGSSSTGKDGKDALTIEEEETDAITDKIPQRPVSVAEGTSYTIIIIAAIGFAGAVLWAVVNELLIQPREYTAFNKTLDKLRDDPRIMVTLGNPVSGYGQESNNRVTRQRIPHRIYSDNEGREHVQVQFMAKGPSGRGRVSADMYQDSAKQWQYYYLIVDLDNGRGRISIVDPHHH